MKYTAYTYLVKCPSGQLYYGTRYAVNRKNMKPEDDLWIDYFTSSRAIHDMIEEYGKDAFEVEIDKMFDSAEEAIKYERKFLLENNVQGDNWINGNIAGGVFPNEDNFRKISEFHKGRPKSEEHRKKISEALKGQKHPWARDNLPENVSGENNGMYGRKHSPETLAKMSAAKKGKPAHNKGKPMSEEQKRKLSESKKGKKRDPKAVLATADKIRGTKKPRKDCPHCGKNIAVNIYARYHGEKCKEINK